MAIQSCVFDAYGTLFDVNAAARALAAEPGREALTDLWPELAAHWRSKQLSYSWLRAITGDYADFWELTCNALDWSMARLGLDDPVMREDLLALYWELPAYREAPFVLAQVAAQKSTAVLSNGGPKMLNGAVDAAGLQSLVHHVISVDEVRSFKPNPAVYALVEKHLGHTPDEVLFVSSNGWDIAGAAGFGFETLWVNRGREPVDCLPAKPKHIAHDLNAVLELI